MYDIRWQRIWFVIVTLIGVLTIPLLSSVLSGLRRHQICTIPSRGETPGFDPCESDACVWDPDIYKDMGSAFIQLYCGI